MRGITSACVPVIVILCLFQGIVARKPKMTPTQGELVIQEGDELKIQCQGEGRLKFSKQTNTIDVDGTGFNSLKEESSGAYTLIVNRTRKEDTGWYACAEEGVAIRNDEQNIDHESNDIAWIYVYVHSSEPFAIDANFDHLTAVAGGRLVVPCRPTSPNLTVKLEINWGTELPENTKYDPKIGYILNEVGRELSAQSFECQVSGPGLVTSSYTLTVLDPAPLDKPRINEDQPRNAVWGTDLTLECEIDVEPGKSGFNMSWEVPKEVPNERWNTKGPIRVTVREKDSAIWQTNLTISKFEKSFDGNYSCHAGAESEHVYSSVVIKSWDPNDRSITATVEGKNSITANETENALWKIEVRTNSKIVTWEWHKPNGERIVLDEYSRYSHTVDGLYHFFNISKLNVEDNGNYTIEFSTEKHKNITILQLTVRAAPSAFIDKVLPYYSPGQSATFTCQTTGQPLPNVTWIMKEYPDAMSTGSPELKYPSTVFNKQGEKGSYRLVSTLQVKINRTGEVTCRSCNEYNYCVDSTEQIFVSDVPDHFNIVDPGLVAEGDDINVMCGASVYNFTDTITWIPEDLIKHEFNTSRIHFTQQRSNFTSQSILEIRDVKKSDGGKYICEVITKEGSTEKKVYQLIVNAAVPPRFQNNSMKDSKIFIDLKNGTDRSMEMMCFAEGLPVPQVTWYKDNQLLVEGNKYQFPNDNNSTLKIAYFREEDSGRYTCRATNRVGNVERHMDINVVGKSSSHTLLIVLTSVFVIIIIIAVAYMGIRLHREKVLRKKLLDAVSVNYQEGAVRCSTLDEQSDLLSDDKKLEFLQEQLTSGR